MTIIQCMSFSCHHTFVHSPVHPSFGRFKSIVDSKKYHWTGGGWVLKIKEQKNHHKFIIDIVIYDLLKIGVNGCCMCF